MAGFEGKNFYFDLENSPQIGRQLHQLIARLGGEIRGFLDHRVKYIITSRPKDQWPPKTTGADKLRQSDACREHTVQSPINLNKNSSFSRGSLLLSKIRANTVNEVKPPALPTDVLERGRFLNITILKDVDVLEFCKNHLSPQVVNDCAVNSAQIKRFNGPNIKVEDNRLQHRPIYKEFFEWPTISYEFHEFLCPFVKKRVQKERVVEPIESLEGLAVKRFNDKQFTNGMNADNKCVNNKTKSHKTKTKTGDKNAKTPPKDVTLIKKNLIKRRRTPAYCEICGTEYEDLSEHLKSEEHETYTKNEDNYKELKGVIQSLQPFLETTSTAAKCVNFDDGSSCESDGEGSEDELPCSPFQSTPNMSTTIQLCGSKHKSHFLPIHDLVGNRSPHEEEARDEVAVEGRHEGRHEDRRSSERSSKTDLEVIPPSISSPKSRSGDKVTLIYNNYTNDSTDSQTNELSLEL